MDEFSKMGCVDSQAMMSLRPRHTLCQNACLRWRSGKSPWRILYAGQWQSGDGGNGEECWEGDRWLCEMESDSETA